jgi:preprotein translocase subunit SecE
MSRIGNYFRDTVSEMKHVTWPTQQQAFVYTALVIVICAIAAVFLGVFDYLFTQVLNMVIG